MFFDRIPKGLNTPLFFSEITVNGISFDFTGSSGGEPQPPVISCEGATDKINFSGIEGYWDFYLDDFDNVLISGMANDLTYYLNTEMSDKLSGDFDGYFWIENLDSQLHRFKMVPLNDVEVPNHYSAHDTNPTLLEHTDGSLTFCLASTNDLYTPAILALNPKAYYPMDELEGSELIDHSPNSLNGEIRDTPNISYRGSSIRRGSLGALGFNISNPNGIAECVVDDSTAGDLFRSLAGLNKSCTIAFWFKPIDMKTYNWLYGHSTNPLMGNANYRLIGYGSGVLQAQSPDNSNVITTQLNIYELLGKSNFIVWRKHHLSQTYTLYLNNISASIDGEASPDGNGSGFHFPATFGYENYGLRGYMSDMAVFDYALTDSQILDLYSKGVLSQ